MDLSDTILFFHLVAWAVVCVSAFLFYYSKDEYRHNPEFANQLHCLSGIILCNRPLFSTLMCGFGGAVLLASVEKVRDDVYALCLLIVIYFGLLLVVHYDVKDYREAHFASLGLLVVVGTMYVERVAREAMFYVYFAATVFFVLILLLNLFIKRWDPPYMTVQALTEIIWVLAFTVSVIAI